MCIASVVLRIADEVMVLRVMLDRRLAFDKHIAMVILSRINCYSTVTLSSDVPYSEAAAYPEHCSSDSSADAETESCQAVT